MYINHENAEANDNVMVRRALAAIVLSLLCMALAFPQSHKKHKIYKSFCDTVSCLRDSIFRFDSLECAAPLIYEASMYRLFIDPVIYEAPIQQKFMPQMPEDLIALSRKPTMLGEYTDIDKFRIDTTVNNMLYDLYLTVFDLDYVTEQEVSNYASFDYGAMKHEPPAKHEVFSLFKPENDYTEAKKVDTRINVNKPNFWKVQGNASFQFSQNYISPNWYKGGESSNNILSSLMLNANYNDKRRIEFDNKLEAKVGFIAMPSDTLHKFNFSSDLLRLTSKLGIKAYSRWYYTVSMEFNTQFFNSYNLNSPTRISSFMAPGNLIFNFGLDYKLSKEKIDLSAFLSPLTYNFRYVGDPLVDETQFGLAEGEKILNSFGSTFQFNMKWTIIPQIIWESRFNYFTSYHKIETEWENTFNFILNRYLSAKLFVHARFYDMEAEHRIQWNELLSFGINYNW